MLAQQMEGMITQKNGPNIIVKLRKIVNNKKHFITSLLLL